MVKYTGKNGKEYILRFDMSAMEAMRDKFGGLQDGMQKLQTNDLTTSWGRAVTSENVWREYPRPQLVRGGWESLNGTWEYAIASAAATSSRPGMDGMMFSIVNESARTTSEAVASPTSPAIAIATHPRRRTILTLQPSKLLTF